MDDTELPDIRMVSGDVGREIVLYVYPNKDSTESLDLTTFELRVIYIKPDKTFVIQDYIDGIMDIPTQVGAVVGNGYYQIRLSKAGEEIYTAQGNLIIDDYILNDSMVKSVAEVNGLLFPDDFLTSADLTNYATKQYVNDAIAEIPVPLDNYSTTEKVVGAWIDGSTVYEITIDIGADITINYNGYDITTLIPSGINLCISCNGQCDTYHSSIPLLIDYTSRNQTWHIYSSILTIVRHITIRYTKNS